MRDRAPNGSSSPVVGGVRGDDPPRGTVHPAAVAFVFAFLFAFAFAFACVSATIVRAEKGFGRTG
ncbi:hypothetical protein [Streptomyces sp. SID3343]|uniref:hypothetical protein n=1 Tax=Streptomyces sp. SID3343 TaxID=2690260 RepID=UPI00136F1358|nr:hypothetical protein [Streptomyces sp. SID3343]MYV98497.1 hypothetical protein [Streptomyces sp. SID3343]